MAPNDQLDRDYYGTLGVQPGAAEGGIRRAYRRLALEWHPDRNPGNPEAEERFKAISPRGGDLVLPLRLTREEARHGGRKRIAVPEDGRRDHLLVTIPAGVRHGARLRLRGKGRAGPKGARGDLYLAVEVGEGR